MSSKFPEESKLPKWAQARLEELRDDRTYLQGELDRTRAAHALTVDHNSWLTIQGPPLNSEEEVRRLFWLSSEGARVAVSLYPGDVLLVGRRNV